MTTTLPSPQQRKIPPSFARAGQLPPRAHHWVGATAAGAGTTIGYAALAPSFAIPNWATVLGTASAAAATAGIGLTGYRSRVRGMDVDRATEQLARIVGVAPSRRLLKATRWSAWGMPGRPGRLTVRYPSAGTVLDPEAIERMTEVLSGQAWGTYRLLKQNHRRNLAVFVPESETDIGDSKKTEELARAKRYVLAALGNTAKIVNTEVDDDGAVTAIEATHEIGHKLAPSGYRDRLERVVSAVLPGRWRARWKLEEDWVRFELRPSLPKIIDQPVPVRDKPMPYSEAKIAYGMDEDGNVMFWQPVIDPHMLLIGGTGTGKTSTVHNVLISASNMGWMVWVVDGKGVEFLGFRDWPNVQIVGSRLEHQVAIIHRAWEEMERRYEAIENGASEDDFEPILLVLDEFADFKGNLLNWYSQIRNSKAGDPTQPRTLQEVASLARKGRTAKIHLLFATQRPDADFFSGRGMGDMRDNFRMRVSMGPLSPQGAMMLWESPTVGTTIPRGCRGRATTINDQNHPVEIQCFYTPDPRKAPEGSKGYELLEVLRPPEITHERLVVLPPDLSELDESEEKDAPPFSEFQWWVNAPWGWAADHPQHDPVARRNDRAVKPVGNLLGLSEFLRPLDEPVGIEPSEASSEHDFENAQPSSETGSATGLAALMAAAGLRPAPPRTDPKPESIPPRPSLTLVVGRAADDDEVPTAGPEDDGLEEWAGYGTAESVAPADLQIGDLVCLDEAMDRWGVVDCEPDSDEFADEGDDLISVVCRDFGDVQELLSIPADSDVLARKPLDDDFDE